MPRFQCLPQPRERFGQLPVAQHRRVVQRRRPSLQRRQVVQRVEHLLVAAVAACVPRHHLATLHHLDAVDVAFDGHGSEGARPRHAVAIAIETHRLVLVDLAPPELTQASNRCAGSGKALAWSCAKRWPIDSV